MEFDAWVAVVSAGLAVVSLAGSVSLRKVLRAIFTNVHHTSFVVRDPDGHVHVTERPMVLVNPGRGERYSPSRPRLHSAVKPPAPKPKVKVGASSHRNKV
jgi:hypothetical protein